MNCRRIRAMCPSTSNRNSKTHNSLFKRPTGVLLDEKQWSFLRDRYHMTPRELQVAILVCQGFNNDEVAKALKIKHGTVKTHLRNLYRRTRVKSKITLLLRFAEDVNRFYIPSRSATPPVPILEKAPKPGLTRKPSRKK